MNLKVATLYGEGAGNGGDDSGQEFDDLDDVVPVNF